MGYDLYPNKMKRLLAATAIILSGATNAQSLWDSTSLIEIKQGSALSQIVRGGSTGGFETSNGGAVSYKGWYSTNWTDARITMMTQVTNKIGFIWGTSTGEQGQKYSIAPSIKTGLVFLHQFDKSSSISMSGTTIIAGALRERPCSGNYGDIGGTQQVNCRMAASTLAPQQTLQYMYNMSPTDRIVARIEFKHVF